jgi:transposase
MATIHGQAFLKDAIEFPNHERDSGSSASETSLTTSKRQRLKELERDVRELRRSNNILRQASAYFTQAELDRYWKR